MSEHDPTTDPATDPATDAALRRLRAADPAAAPPRLDLTADQVRDRGGSGETLTGAAPRWSVWRIAAVVAAALVLVAGLGIGLRTWRGGSVVGPLGPDPSVAAPADPTPPPALPALTCDDPGPEVDHAPTDAVVVRLCDATTHTDILGRIPPPDLLFTDVAGLTALINALPPSSSAQACTDELSATYRLVLAAQDGTPVHLRGELYGCRVIGDRLGADDVLAGFAERLREQRARVSQVKTVEVAPDCTRSRSAYVPPEPADVVAGWVCWRLPSEGADTTEPLTAADVTAIRDDLAARATTEPVETPRCGETTQVAVVLVDVFGAPLTFDSICRSVWIATRDGTTVWWVPTPAVRDLLFAAVPD